MDLPESATCRGQQRGIGTGSAFACTREAPRPAKHAPTPTMVLPVST
eukprot:CAMPEP_0179270506 /NCGR_PEP_ID=MMETSP0797-20121207/31502_1 /TAXON_ID=47934 /ORGANISM="Dinophysis acuminata, Strain DAEP01" /LENGTH=46 /DNA_ID= /DNA_START= /DNA_END= /DNA_ORIENTATION=